MYNSNYVVNSLELHLFFGRIMKEHSLFLRAGFTPADTSFSAKAEFYMKEFEKLLCEAVALSNGVISDEALCSGEIVTKFTVPAEKQTECFTGLPINRDITEKELNLTSGNNCFRMSRQKLAQVRQLNRTALRLLDGLISFKESILSNVLNCRMFTANYPLLIEHITREARLYREYLMLLERNGELDIHSVRDIESFWNRIMMEHAMFLRGLLDPSEEELINTADEFAKDYKALLEACRNAYDRTLTADALEKTLKFRDFKAAGAEGIQQCEIRSIILPLLADHVLREANHYIRLLNC